MRCEGPLLPKLMIPRRRSLQYFAVKDPTIDVTMTIAAMVVADKTRPYNAARAMENSPLLMVFPQISIPARADSWITIPVITPEISLLTIARMQIAAIMNRICTSGKVDRDAEKYKENNEENVLERAGVLLKSIRVGGCKRRTKCNHHQGLGHLEHDCKGCSREDCCKGEENREFIITVKDRNKELLAPVGRAHRARGVPPLS